MKKKSEKAFQFSVSINTLKAEKHMFLKNQRNNANIDRHIVIK